jgi:hypothetical protein
VRTKLIKKEHQQLLLYCRGPDKVSKEEQGKVQGRWKVEGGREEGREKMAGQGGGRNSGWGGRKAKVVLTQASTAAAGCSACNR